MIEVARHTVIKLTPKAYGCDEERFTLPIEAVDTTRYVLSTSYLSSSSRGTDERFFLTYRPRPLGRVDSIKKERDLGTLSPSTSRPPSRGKPFPGVSE